LIIVLAIFLLRSQATTGDVSFMRSMIPHHSQAIIRSERANITDTRVQELANEIIEAQREEIEEMKRLIEDLEAN